MSDSPQALAAKLAELCASPALAQRKLRFMEVCGTHTMSVYRHGLKKLLPANVELISGPGCPVCVTPAALTAQALAWARQPGVTLVSFGDMLRVPVARDSLLQARAEGCDVRMVISPLEALQIAEQEPRQQVIFFAVGFETTAPLSAATILQAAQQRLKNFSLFSAHRLMPPALRRLLRDGPHLDGLLLPGHVSAVSGADYFAFVPEELALPAVVAGFEPAEILSALLMLAHQAAARVCRLENAYSGVVRPEPSPTAWAALQQAFLPADAYWRGLGEIAGSGLAIRPAYAAYDAAIRFGLPEAGLMEIAENPACCCGLVLRGEMKPSACPLFGAVCSPEDPQGACMVSSEGACAAVYRYEKIEDRG